MSKFTTDIKMLSLSSREKTRLKALSKTTPLMKLADFYHGKLRATGITCGPFGGLKRRFTADVKGVKDSGNLTLNEDFTYDDDRKFSREWSLKALNSEGTKFSGTGADISGDIYGESCGCAALLKYTLMVPKKGGSHRTINVTHWQYQIDETKTIHKLTLSKWFIPIVKSTVVFERIG